MASANAAARGARPSSWAVLKRTVREFREDNMTDWAAALTYYGVLSIFPALIVLVALLGVLGEHPRTTDAMLDIVEDLSPGATSETLEEPIVQVIQSEGGAGALLAFVLLGALWTASGSSSSSWYGSGCRTSPSCSARSSTPNASVRASSRPVSRPRRSCSCRRAIRRTSGARFA